MAKYIVYRAFSNVGEVMYLSDNELKAIENDDCTVLSYDSWLVREMKRTNYGLKDCFACKYPVGDCTCF
jgi:hypothetical protein